jgi:hypothetical protein
MPLNIKKNETEVLINGVPALVKKKWYKGASRYNNGATLYKRKYLLRLIIGRQKSK